MEQDQNDIEPGRGAKPRASINLGAFLLAFLFVWLVFDNIALGLLVALFVGGGQRWLNAPSIESPENGTKLTCA